MFFYHFILFLLSFSIYAQEEHILQFFGDLMAHNINYQSKDYASIYKPILPILKNGSLNFVNLEFVMDENRPYSSYPAFNVKRNYVQAAIDAGFNVFAQANNHINDFGLTGINATHESIAYFKTLYPDLVFSGLKNNQEPYGSIQKIQLGSIKIGFLSITGIVNSYASKEKISLVRHTDWWTEQKITTGEDSAFIDWIKQQKKDFDFLILSFHDGMEYRTKAEESKKKFIRALLEAGVDVLWGHHPHVLQEIDFYVNNRKEGKKIALYSLGNLISGQLFNLKAHQYDTQRSFTGFSAYAKIYLKKDVNGNISFNFKAFPLMNVFQKDTYVIHPYENKENLSLSPEWKIFYDKKEPFLKKVLTENIIELNY